MSQRDVGEGALPTARPASLSVPINTQIPYAHGDVQFETVFDRKSDRYLAVILGREKNRRRSLWRTKANGLSQTLA